MTRTQNLWECGHCVFVVYTVASQSDVAIVDTERNEAMSSSLFFVFNELLPDFSSVYPQRQIEKLVLDHEFASM